MFKIRASYLLPRYLIRLLLDEAIARRCQEVGADLKENSPVADAKFDKEKGLWTIYLEDGVCSSHYQAMLHPQADSALFGYCRRPLTSLACLCAPTELLPSWVRAKLLFKQARPYLTH